MNTPIYQEIEIDKGYSQATKCPICGSTDLFFCWMKEYEDKPDHFEMVKECQECSEFIKVIYDENKKIVENINGGPTDRILREKWLEKNQK